MATTSTTGLHRKIAAIVADNLSANYAGTLGLIAGEGTGRPDMVAKIIQAAVGRAPALKCLVVTDTAALMGAVGGAIARLLGVQPSMIGSPDWDANAQFGLMTIDRAEALPERIAAGRFYLVITVVTKTARAIENRRALRQICERAPHIFVVCMLADEFEARYFRGTLHEIVDARQLAT